MGGFCPGGFVQKDFVWGDFVQAEFVREILSWNLPKHTVHSRFQSFFAKSCQINQILFSRYCSTSMKISITQKMKKKYLFGVKLQNFELNLVLRKTAMTVRQVPFARRLFS